MGITTTAIYAPGDTITSAWANILRTNTGVLDSRTGGDPAAADKWLISDGATSAVWVARAGSISHTQMAVNAALANLGAGAITNVYMAAGAALANLGYTPVNKAGDTGIGNLTSTGTLTALGVVAGANGISAGAGGVATTGAFNPASYTGGSTAAGSPSVLGLNVGTSGVAVNGAVAATGAVSGATGTFSGALSGASISGGTTSTGSPSVLGLNVGTNGVATAGQIASSVSTGTAPLSVASTTKVTNLNADLLDGLSSSAFPLFASGSYSGNGVSTGRQIATGFLTKFVHIFATNGVDDLVFLVSTTAKSLRLNTGPGINGQGTVHLHASDGFTVGDTATDGNASGWTYTYVAFG